MDASGGVTVRRLNWHTFTNEFESQWVPYSFSLVPYRIKKVRKLLLVKFFFSPSVLTFSLFVSSILFVFFFSPF